MTHSQSHQLYPIPNTNIEIFFATQPASELIGIYAKTSGNFFHLGQFSAKQQKWWEATQTFLEKRKLKSASHWEYITSQSLFKKNQTQLFSQTNITLIMLKHIEILASWFALQRLKNFNPKPEQRDTLIHQEEKLKTKLHLIGFNI